MINRKAQLAPQNREAQSSRLRIEETLFFVRQKFDVNGLIFNRDERFC